MTETKFPKIRNPSDERFAQKFMQKQLQNPEEKSNTLLKKSTKPVKQVNDNIKLDEQFNFMNKYNKEVRERNRIRNLKDNNFGVVNGKNSHACTIDNTREEKDASQSPSNNGITPTNIKSSIASNEYFDKAKSIQGKNNEGVWKELNSKIRGMQPSKIDLKNNSIGSIITHNVEETEVKNNKSIEINDTNVKMSTDPINNEKQENTVLPDIKKKSDQKELKRASSRKSLCHERDINRVNESTFTITGEKLAEDENPYGVENKLLVKVHSHQSSFPTNNMNKDNQDETASQRKNFRQHFEASKRKKLKELKKLKQFSPYFANLFKSDKKVASVIKNFESAEKRGGYNQKLFKVYGVHRLIPRYKKKSDTVISKKIKLN